MLRQVREAMPDIMSGDTRILYDRRNDMRMIFLQLLEDVKNWFRKEKGTVSSIFPDSELHKEKPLIMIKRLA